MRRVLRENALAGSMAALGCAAVAWLSLYGFAWNDYDTEARPAFDALVHGHVLDFLRLAPAYGGSLVERAPFALLPGLWGGGQLAVYRAVALPCLLAGALLGLWLLSGMRARGDSRLARAVALGVCVANPLTLRALELGHPEELLGGCMCVAAVLLAGRGRWLASGAILGLAVANKEWALLAAGPVLLALPPGVRVRAVGAAAAVAAAVLAPLALVSSGGFTAAGQAVAAPPSLIFQPWQVFWFLGHHGALVHGAFGIAKPGYRVAPAWTGSFSHPLILALGLLVTVVLWVGGARRPGRLPARVRASRLGLEDALLALALLLLLRCVLDTWDAVYYPLPFILALLAWETRRGDGRPPVLTLASSLLMWASFQWLPEHASPDTQAAFFLAWTVPLAAWLTARLQPVGERRARVARLDASGAPAQETTVSALERLVST
jgi:heme exporter protein D